MHWFRDALLRGDLVDGKARSREMTGKALWTVKAILGHAQKVPHPEDVKAMIDAAGPRWRVLVMTAAFTGLRASELRAYLV